MAKEQQVVLINQCKGDQIAAHDGSEGARVQANKGVEDGGCTPGNDAAAGLSASTLATEATPPPARRVGRAVPPCGQAHGSPPRRPLLVQARRLLLMHDRAPMAGLSA